MFTRKNLFKTRPTPLKRTRRRRASRHVSENRWVSRLKSLPLQILADLTFP